MVVTPPPFTQRYIKTFFLISTILLDNSDNRLLQKKKAKYILQIKFKPNNK